MGVLEFEASVLEDQGWNCKKPLFNQLQLPKGAPESIEVTVTYNELNSHPRVPVESA